MKIDIYNYKFIYNFKQGDKVSWNKKIFKSCPFNVDETKTITEISKTAKNICCAHVYSMIAVLFKILIPFIFILLSIY